MKRRVVVLLLAVLLSLACDLPALPTFPSTTPDESGEGEQEEEAQDALLVYQILDEDIGEVVAVGVADSNGEELTRISLREKMGISYLMPLPGNHRAWLHNAEGDIVYLVDAAQGRVRQLELPEDASGVHPGAHQFRFSGGGDCWALLGSVRGDLSFLVNLETARTHDLITISDELGYVLSGLFSPEESHLVLAGSWMVPTEDLDDARRLGTEEFIRSDGFSSDSRQVIYIQRTESEQWEG